MSIGPYTVGQVPGSPQPFSFTQSDGVTPRDISGYVSINMITVGPDEKQIAASAMGNLSAVASGSNQVTLSWSNVSPFASAGSYRYYFEFIGPGSVKDRSGVGQFEVLPVAISDPTTGWATINDVMKITKQIVTQDELDVAQVMIDMVSNRTPDVSGALRSRDIMWLQRAVAFQAVWLQGRPDILTFMSAKTVSQDGESVTYEYRADQYIGPLAQRCLKNLKWKRSRSLRLRTPFVDGDSDTYGTNQAANDLLEDWQDLGSWS